MGLSIAASTATTAPGARLIDLRPVDEQYLMIHWLDGEVEYKDDGEGPGAFMGHESGGHGDRIVRYEPPLATAAAQDPASYTLTSPDDPAYAAGLHPEAAYRKTKVNGTTNQWPDPPHTLEHTVYLKLPHPMRQGKRYTLGIAPAVSSDTATRDVTFDVFATVSEAVHVNLIGYDPAHTVAKSADLYMWLGDGGARDYAAFAGRKVHLYDVGTRETHEVGQVRFWKKSGRDVGNWNLTRSDVWTCDFAAFTGTGTYRLVVDGVGCSPDFELRRDVYREPFRTSVRGFYYMRIGEPRGGMVPAPRQPRFIPEVDPPDFRVYRTTFAPWHPDWHKSGRDTWDVTDWSTYNEPGNPTNPHAWGGHSDACDWDRHAGHVSIIWDLLLPYLLSNGRIGDDDLGIRESGNGIPDLIDEARYEVDFWLRLRDGTGGYSFGVNCPPKDHSTMYQAAARPYMAWANAANCAMLADSFRVAGDAKLTAHYRDAAVEAWKVANDQDLDFSYSIGNGVTRGRDLKMIAAAFLYNVTGDRAYEDAMVAESVAATDPTAEVDKKDAYNQLWGMAAYLLCDRDEVRPVHHPQALENFRQAVTREAIAKNVRPTEARPSRRATNDAYGWFPSIQEVQAACVAHAVAADPADRDALLGALILEADYGLGRNPLNMVQMTGLGSRHVRDIYTSGRNDGTPGVHPGHTPYMNAEPWGKGYMADPKGWYGGKGYPAWDRWPYGEALWRARYCYANNEFTPQQSMRGKMCLLGYLYALGRGGATE